MTTPAAEVEIDEPLVRALLAEQQPSLGDLHPSNMLSHDGKLSAIIDFGDITSGRTTLPAVLDEFG